MNCASLKRTTSKIYMTPKYRTDKRSFEFDVMYNDKDQALCKNTECGFACKALQENVSMHMFQYTRTFECSLARDIKLSITKKGIIKAPKSCPLHKVTANERIDVIVSGRFGAT